VAEAAGQLAVGVDLREQGLRLVLEGGDRVGTGGEARRRLVLAGELDERGGELRGVAACRPFMLFQPATVCAVRSA